MSHATFIHFPSLKLVLFISSKLTKRCLPPPPVSPSWISAARAWSMHRCSAILGMPIGNAQMKWYLIGCNPSSAACLAYQNLQQEQLPSIIPTPSTLLCFLAKAWRAASSRKGTAALDSLNLQESKICVLHSCWVSSFKRIIWDNSEYGSLSSSLGLWTRINLLMTHLLLFKLYRRQLHHSHTCNQPPGTGRIPSYK